MSSVVLGRNIFLEMFINDGFYKLFCSKTMRYVSDMDMIETTSVNSPNTREYIAGLMNGSVSLSGITMINAVNSKVSVIYLLQEQVRRIKQQFRMTFLDQNGDTCAVSFDGFIKTVSIDKDVLQWSQSGLSIQVSGAFEIDQPIPAPTVPEFEEFSDWWDCVEGQNYVEVGDIASGEHSYLLTDDDVILEVDLEGQQYDLVSGSPGNRQVRFNTSTLRMEFQNNFGPNNRIFVLFSRAV